MYHLKNKSRLQHIEITKHSINWNNKFKGYKVEWETVNDHEKIRSILIEVIRKRLRETEGSLYTNDIVQCLIGKISCVHN